MYKAIGSKKRISTEVKNDAVMSLYVTAIEDLIGHETVLEMRNHFQHCHTSRLQHSINVSYYSFLICHYLKLDWQSAARAGLLHDLYFYTWSDDAASHKGHISRHPKLALENAKKVTELNAVEVDAITKHMWPCTLSPPKYPTSAVVNIVDTGVTIFEVLERKYSASRLCHRLHTYENKSH
ncbi:MAG: HD domain-containing protein [Bacillota bacterium]